LLTGTVVDFDEHRGSGTVRGDGGRELAFHCTSLADGSRVIEPGTAVVFTVVAGHHGRWEAAEITPLDSPSLSPPAPSAPQLGDVVRAPDVAR